MRHLSASLLVVLAFLFAFVEEGHCLFFTPSEVTLVKESPTREDRSLTYGQVFDNYKHCEDGEWDVIEDDQGRKIVEFRADYLDESIIRGMFWNEKGLFKSGEIDSICKYITKMAKPQNVKMCARFMILDGGKSFSDPVLFLEFKDKILKFASSYIFENNPVYLYEGSHLDELGYYAWKYVINTHLNIEDLKVAYMLYMQLTPKSRMESYALFLPKEIRFDDENLKIYYDFKMQYTDITKKKLEDSGYNQNNNTSYISDVIKIRNINFENIEYKIYAENEYTVEHHGYSPRTYEISSGIVLRRGKGLFPGDVYFGFAELSGDKISKNKVVYTYRSDTEPPQEMVKWAIEREKKDDELIESKKRIEGIKIGVYSNANGWTLDYSKGDADAGYGIILQHSDMEDCFFRGSCTQKDGKMLCTDLENQDNTLQINTQAGDILSIGRGSKRICNKDDGISGSFKPVCLQEELKKGVMTGTYEGTESTFSYPIISFTLEDGTDEFVHCEPEQRDIFEGKEGQKVTIPYITRRVWIGGQCEEMTFLDMKQK